MTSRTAQNVARAREALALLYGPLPTQDERLEAARVLWLEHALPEPEQLQLPKGIGE
jgi:hypothetical protein